MIMMIKKIEQKQYWDYEQPKQTREEKEQCMGCYANPRTNAQVDLQRVCTQRRRQMQACGKFFDID